RSHLDDGTLTTNPAAYALLANRSACLQSLGRFEEAKQEAQACVTIRPQWPKGWGRLADALMGLEQWEEAKKALESGLALKPSIAADFE
ncbi:tetratricopeptide repeat protein, partial [Xanthomonas citri pv. citri]|nr:tetratricopeptide repeat protein [Xanthomonas citri pv. citri]